MHDTPSLDELWRTAPAPYALFDVARIAHLPLGARRYLTHAIVPGTPLANAVRLRMHGEIKQRGWSPFAAEQVIRWARGMIWRATVSVHGVAMRGRLGGLVAIFTAEGADITRSAAGRAHVESIWVPSVLCADDVRWSERDAVHPHARFRAHGEAADVDYMIDEGGRLLSSSISRWGNPEGGAFHYLPCGGYVEQEGRFGGYTIPTRMRVGWYFGTDRYARDGEFFRVTIDEATFR